MNYCIGIDIGGTKIIFIVMSNFRILEIRKILTPKNKKGLIKALKENILELKGKRPIERIGIGIPGPLNEKRDLILNPSNLRYLRNYPLAKILEKELKIKVRMDNDVNCFTLGETVMGVGRDSKIVFGITLGTGVGGGLVMRSKLNEMKPELFIYWGVFGSAGEVGHMSIKFNGPKCTCGSFGCLEEYCSERFFLKRGASPLEFQKRAKKGDKKALEIYGEFGKYLGIGLANLINILDPEMIVIGGGISEAYKFFIKEAKKEIKNRVDSLVSKKNVKIKKAKLGEYSGAIGSTFLS